MDTICAHLAEGGTLITLAEAWDIPFGWISAWISADKDRGARYKAALNDRSEWVKEMLLHELRRVGFMDLRKLFDEDGKLKRPADWPAEVAHAISSVEVDELFEGRGNDRKSIGETKKIKLWDKIKSLELLGKNLTLFTEKVEHSGKITLEDLVAGSYDKNDE